MSINSLSGIFLNEKYDYLIYTPFKNVEIATIRVVDTEKGGDTRLLFGLFDVTENSSRYVHD